MSQAHGCRMEMAFSFFRPGVQRAAGCLDLRFMQGDARRNNAVTRIGRQGGTELGIGGAETDGRTAWRDFAEPFFDRNYNLLLLLVCR